MQLQPYVFTNRVIRGCEPTAQRACVPRIYNHQPINHTHANANKTRPRVQNISRSISFARLLLPKAYRCCKNMGILGSNISSRTKKVREEPKHQQGQQEQQQQQQNQNEVRDDVDSSSKGSRGSRNMAVIQQGQQQGQQQHQHQWFSSCLVAGAGGSNAVMEQHETSEPLVEQLTFLQQKQQTRIDCSPARPPIPPQTRRLLPCPGPTA